MRYILSWILFCAGAFVGLITDFRSNSERWAAFWYPIANWLMVKSERVQGSGRGPWY